MSKTLFIDTFKRNLKHSMSENPENYNLTFDEQWPVFEKHLQSNGVLKLNINSRSFRRTCKELNIKCTYTAINQFIGVRSQCKEVKI